MGSPRRTPSSRLSSLPRVRTGLRPVSLARTFSAFWSFSPPSPTPMLTVTLAMRAAVIGFSRPVRAGAAGSTGFGARGGVLGALLAKTDLGAAALAGAAAGAAGLAAAWPASFGFAPASGLASPALAGLAPPALSFGAVSANGLHLRLG